MRKKRSLLQKIFLIAGIIIIACVAGVKIYIWHWDTHSSAVGHQLVTNLVKRQKSALSRKKSGSVQALNCQQINSKSAASGLLMAPSIALEAPVMQGDSDAVLAVAVGHDPNSVWPGGSGRSVLQAHDVSYFVNIDKLKIGSTLIYETTCKKYTFKVVGHQVVKQGSPVYNSSNSTMTLVTCWPTDALWFTPDRYLVNLDEVKVSPLVPGTKQNTAVKPLLALSKKPAFNQKITVPAPAALFSQGLTLQQNSIPMGKMVILGKNDYQWMQSPAPLDVESEALESYIGAIKSLKEGNYAWWNLLAPGVPVPSGISPGSTVTYASGLQVDIYAQSSAAYAVKLHADINIVNKNGSSPFSETITLEIKQNKMLITSFLFN